MSIYLLARTCRHDLVLAGSLRGVQRPVSGAEQLLRRGGLVVREAGDAEARGDALAVRVGEGRDDLPYPVRVEPSAALRGLDQQDGELVAAVAGDDVDAARVLHEDLTDIAQRLVADRVAELVVDALEAVQVEHHDGDRVIEPPEARDLLLEAEREEASIVETGDLVLERGLLELGVGGLELAVGGVEAHRERVDVDRLLLDGPAHVGKRPYGGTALIATTQCTCKLYTQACM